MNNQTADREGLAEVLLRKFQAPETEWARRDLMSGALEDADAILASPQFARIIAEAEARALREAAEAVPDRASRFAVYDTTRVPMRVTYVSPVRWLRDRAALVAPDARGEG